VVIPDAMMTTAGDDGPCLISELIALERFSKEANMKYAPEMFAFYKENLGIEYSKYVCMYCVVFHACACILYVHNTHDTLSSGCSTWLPHTHTNGLLCTYMG